MAKSNVIRVGDVEIMALSDGMLEFDLCNFFPTIPERAVAAATRRTSPTSTRSASTSAPT